MKNTNVKAMSKQTNIILWILQILLSLYNAAGAVFLVGNYRLVANRWALTALPKPFWLMLEIIQILLSLGLVLPGLKGKLTSYSAVGFAIVSFLGAAFYISYSGFPGILWAIVPAILALFVAFKRWS